MTEWGIPHQDRLRYTQLFNLHDRNGTGFLSGVQCRGILLQSGLPKNILAEIWNLSDIDSDGQLTREEFILAMHLTNHVKSGHSLPSKLYPDLIPPSCRRYCRDSILPYAPISSYVRENCDNQKSTDLHRPTFVSLSNSFEDRRRENYEKGRAELERRRLNIIEQQIAIFREQFTVSNSQVAQVKDKIEAMQTESGTKMRLINSLKVQLNKIRDRKAHLDREELNLIAKANDLKSIDCETNIIIKQPIIEQIHNEKLAQLLEENKKKAEELAIKTRKIEELKLRLEMISDTANESYENYKNKLNNAKKKLNQFIEENGSAVAVDFDPVRIAKSIATVEMIDSRNGAILFPTNHHTTTTSISLSSTCDNENQNDLSQKLCPGPQLFEQATNQIFSSVPVQQIATEYKALYAFRARNSDELTIAQGDVLVCTKQEVCEPGWLYGHCDNRSGLFPEAYVEPLETDVRPVAQLQNNIPTVTTEKVRIFSAGESDNSIVLLSTSETNHIKYKVIYTFNARNRDELTINQGDIIIASDSVNEPGWLKGELNGRIGLFPEAYVMRIDNNKSEHDLNACNRVRNSLDTSINPSQLDYLIQELIETEADYIDDLRLCHDIYIKPLQSNFSDVTQSIFINWDKFIQMHNSAFCKLSSRDKKKKENNLFHVFEIYQNLLCSALVDLYIVFCSQQNQSTKKYEAKLASDIRFKQLVNECQRKLARKIEQEVSMQAQWSLMDTDCDKSISSANSRILQNSNLPLTSLLLKPMQRITKYSLLFDRILDVITKKGPLELRNAAEQVKISAQSLCQKVNEACRLKEDLEDNKRKLHWAQIHIEQTKHSGRDSLTQIGRESQSPPILIDHLNRDNTASVRMSVFDSEVILLDSETKFLGPRQLIKAGSLLREPNYSREFVLFLFNDLLLTTKVKGGLSSILRVENVFLSPRAQRAYYKLYENPIHTEDVIIHISANELIKQQQQQHHSIEQQQQVFEVGFSDKSTGASYILSALNAHEQIDWIRELENTSNKARASKGNDRMKHSWSQQII